MARSIRYLVKFMKRKCCNVFGQAPDGSRIKFRKLSARVANKSTKSTDAKLFGRIWKTEDAGTDANAIEPGPKRWQLNEDAPKRSGSVLHGHRGDVSEQGTAQAPPLGNGNGGTAAAQSYEFTDAESAVYTKDAPRMVLVHDGTQQSVALLLNEELGQRMRAFVLAERELSLDKEQRGIRRPVITKFLADARKKDSQLRDHLRELERDCDNQAELEACNRELDGLDQKVRLADEVERELDRKIEGLEAAISEDRLQAAIALNEVFEECKLVPALPPKDTDPEVLRQFVVSASESFDLDSRDGGEAPARRRSTSTRDARDEALGSRRENQSRAKTSQSMSSRHDEIESRERDARRVLLEDYQSSLRLLDIAQAAFDSRAIRLRQEDDLQHLQRGRDLTRRLVEAEEAYTVSKVAALAAGVNVPGTALSSGFVDRESDGGGESGAAAEAAQAPRRVHQPTIRKWIDAIPYEMGDFDISDVPFEGDDALESLKVVDVWESRSSVADGKSRKRIDKWRETCIENDHQ